ncbi:MAG TPA: hypothetical protein PK760_05330, partial [Flavobacteriales bacterium]|nr:hypothetical protein [Flavobacteriales bacterium]
MTPARVLAFVCAVLLMLAAIGWIVPKDGLHIVSLDLRFPSPREVLFPEEQKLVDISDILAVETDSIASPLDTMVVDTTASETTKPFLFDECKLRPLEEHIKLHYPEEGKQAQHGFFAALESSCSRAKHIRIRHYRDT